jgi:hypothetical protein
LNGINEFPRTGFRRDSVHPPVSGGWHRLEVLSKVDLLSE